jgi:hypothetical protein
MPSASAFTTGRTASSFDPTQMEFSAKTGSWAVVHVYPKPDGGYARDVTELTPGHNMVVGTHAIFHGYVTFNPSFDQRLRPWSPDQAPMSPPQEWTAPSEAIRLPLLVDRYGPLWWTATSIIALNATMAQIEVWAATPEFQQGQLPVVEIGKSRPVKIKDRPGETFYAPVLQHVGWVPLEQAQLGPRVTPILPPPAVRPRLLSNTPVPLVQPAIQAKPGVTDLPWEETVVPKPLPTAASDQAASPDKATTASSADPFAIFRRQG